jgi:carbamoyltransferase
LGISYGHGDSSAALVVDGLLVAAAEEERFSRVKHDARFPSQAIAYCLKHAGLVGRDIGVVAIARDPRKHWWRKVRTVLSHPQLLERISPKLPIFSLSNELRALGIDRARHYRLEHHLAHMMSTRYLSSDESTAFLSIDGLGDFVSTALGKIDGPGIEIVDRIYFPHSLGFFYTALTHYLGFPHFGDEFKVMGLSALGKNAYSHAMRELVRDKPGLGFELNLEAFPLLRNGVPFSVEQGQPKISPFFSTGFLTQVIGLPPRKPLDPITEGHRNLAKSVQVRFEEVANQLLGRLHEKVTTNAVAISGGCAHNSVWVGKILKRTPFKKVFVAPAAHDGGLAVGAAIAAAKIEVMPESHWALLGPGVEETISTTTPSLDRKEYENEAALIQWVVEQLVQEKIGGFMVGRMELGPRALGGRSILADPRRLTMKNRLNQRVKHREPFRPFAASVLAEHQSLWFKDSFDSPAMEAVFETEDLIRERIPAVVHADHSCRIQTVKKETQPFFWSLIEAFRKKTGVPMLLNTSFNDNEPIVCSSEDAIRCFQNTDLDFLVIGRSTYLKIADQAVKAG